MIHLPCPRSPMAWEVFGLIIIPAITMAVALPSEVTAAIDSNRTEAIEVMASGIADSMAQQKMGALSNLAGMYRQKQTGWLIIAPPGADFILKQDYGMMVFDPKTFPDDFNKKLVGVMKYDCPVYFLTISEDPVTRETVFSDADGKEIARLKPEEGYNPYWLLDLKYPDLYSGIYGSDEIKEIEGTYDPSRIQITVTLLPSDYLSKYALVDAVERVIQAEEIAKSSKINPPPMRYQSSGMTNLELVAIERATNGMKLTLAYPDGFTNRVDLFSCFDLIGNWWDLGLNATNVSVSTNCIQWVDVNAFSQSWRFYAAGNADVHSDFDGISDAREQFMYHTCSTNWDTDGDNLSDSNEVFVLKTDPNNSKTNKPNVWISYPANESRKVWLP